jgi:hypothetical protein
MPSGALNDSGALLRAPKCISLVMFRGEVVSAETARIDNCPLLESGESLRASRSTATLVAGMHTNDSMESSGASGLTLANKGAHVGTSNPQDFLWANFKILD